MFGFTKTKKTAGGKAAVVKSLDERISLQPQAYFAPGIGLWALRKALRVHAHEHEHDGERHLHMHAHPQHIGHEQLQAHHHHTHAAFGIGVLHGLAGSSHFLGVLPILAFPTHAGAIAYLTAFGVGTVASMAAFSWVIGSLATRCASRGATIYRALMTGCAAIAMGVGCFWLFQ